MNISRILRNSRWMAMSRVGMAGVRFFTVPLLLHHYGKGQFGVIALALSLNAYLMILSMGLPSGIVRFVALKIEQSDQEGLGKLCGSGFSLYLIIGLVNGLILGGISFWAGQLFHITAEQAETLRFLIVISAMSSLIFWIGSYLDQLLTAAEEIAWLSKLQMLQVVLELSVVLVVTQTKLSIEVETYFIFYLLSLHAMIPLKIWRWQKYISIKDSLLPCWNWTLFKPVFKYSAWMLLFSILSVSAVQLRPILLGVRAVNGAESVADYKILLGVASFVIMAYGWLATPLLPAASKAYGTGGLKAMNDMIINWSKPAWAVLGVILFGFVSCSKPLLILYVGKEYGHLSAILDIWLLSLAVSLFLGPSGVGVMASGRIRPLACMTFISCFLSLAVLWYFAPLKGLLAAVYAIVTYYILQLILYLVILLPCLITGSVWSFFVQNFFPTFIVGLGSAMIARWAGLQLNIESNLLHVCTNGIIFFVLYTILTILFVVRLQEIKNFTDGFKKNFT